MFLHLRLPIGSLSRISFKYSKSNGNNALLLDVPKFFCGWPDKFLNAINGTYRNNHFIRSHVIPVHWPHIQNVTGSGIPVATRYIIRCFRKLNSMFYIALPNVTSALLFPATCVLVCSKQHVISQRSIKSISLNGYISHPDLISYFIGKQSASLWWTMFWNFTCCYRFSYRKFGKINIRFISSRRLNDFMK